LKEVQLDFQPDDVVVMYTDGITEARNSTRQDAIMFGLDRLVESIEKTPQKTAPAIFNQITVDLSKFMGYKNRQLDDITLLVIHYHNGEALPVQPIPEEQISEWNWNS